MQIAQVLANYSLGGAYMLRRAMGKIKAEEMATQRDDFMAGASARGIDADQAGSIFDLMEKFAGYGFNKSHSAAYALVSYQTAWLKCHYPAHFMAAVLSADMQNTDKVVTLIEECRSMHIPLVVPSVNVGAYNFTVNKQREIVYGLGAIKGLGEGPVNSIIMARQQGGPFTSLLDFCQRVDARSLNKRALEALIRAGALDCLQPGDPDTARATLTASMADSLQAAEQASRNQAAGVLDMFGDISPVAETQQMRTVAAARPWTQRRRLSAEKETLGLYLSGHPIDEYLDELKYLTRDRLANVKPERESQMLAGLVVAMRTMKSKRGDTIAFLTLDDRSARLEVSLGGKEYEQYRELLKNDEILIVDCLVNIDDYSGSMRGRVKGLSTLQEARQQHVKSLSLTVNQQELPANFVSRLCAALEPYRMPETAANTSNNDYNTLQDMPSPSACPVFIHYSRTDISGEIALSRDWAVRLEQDLLQRLQEEFGKKNVVVNYRQATDYGN